MKLLTSLLLAFALAPQAPVQPPPSSQAPVPQVQAPPPPAQTPPAAKPELAGPPLAARYTIGPQDQLKITVFDEADLTGNYRVDSDGFVTFPLVGRVPASGLTLGELQDRLTSMLAAGYIKNPQVRIEIDQYKSQSVYVSGEVRTPGKITMTGTMTLLEALALAGSPMSSASSELTIAHVRRAMQPGGQATPDAEPDEVVKVNWKDLQIGKGSDVVLADGDIINVPKAQTFYITGQVRNPGHYVLEPGMTVEQAIAVAGGLNERGSNRRIKVARIVNGKREEVEVKLTDKVLPDDTITIPQRFF